MFTASRLTSWPGFATIALALVILVRPGAAADTSAWDGDSRSAMRLLAGTSRDKSELRAGVEIRLAPGWKTYWRYPGDAGVPPQFDFSASDNVQAAQVEWPAPIRFSDGEGNTIGYKDDVILPLRIVPKDPARAVLLRLKLSYAICEKLCVPVDAASELSLTDSSASSEQAIAQAERRVPEKIPFGAHRALAITAVMREAGSPARVSVEVAAPLGSPVTLFAEGPSADWALPLPEPKEGATPGHRRFVFALDGIPPGAKADGAAITLTAVSGDQATETTFHLD